MYICIWCICQTFKALENVKKELHDCSLDYEKIPRNTECINMNTDINAKNFQISKNTLPDICCVTL